MVSLHLENCENCIFLPPLGQLSSLNELSISRMSGVTEVGHGFYGKSGFLSKPFESLETLHFEEMEWVDWHTIEAGVFSRLQNLVIIECPRLLGHLPRKVPSLVRLEIRGCPKLVGSLPRTTSMRKLDLENCQEVQFEWQDVSSIETLWISGFSNLEEFARELVTLTNLEAMSLEECRRLVSFPEGMMSGSVLKRLNVQSCPKLVLPLSLEMSHCYTSLERLIVDGCWSLKCLPLGLFPKLSFLEITDCENFETLLIPDGIELQNLQMLYICGSVNMASFPCRELPAPNLISLWLFNCGKLKALPERMHTLLPYLRQLWLDRCPEIESFPEGGLPSKLIDLAIRNCKKFVRGRRDWGLQILPSLRFFSLADESEDGLESFPEVGLLPSTLRNLIISDLPNLKSLNKRGLQIMYCPLLKSRYNREEGKDWRKIAHVPAINMDGEGFIDQIYLGPVPDAFPGFFYPAPSKTCYLTLNETSEAMGGPSANPAKKQEIEDNSRKIGVVIAKLNSGDISRNATEKLVQLCQSFDNGDFGLRCCNICSS